MTPDCATTSPAHEVKLGHIGFVFHFCSWAISYHLVPIFATTWSDWTQHPHPPDCTWLSPAYTPANTSNLNFLQRALIPLSGKSRLECNLNLFAGTCNNIFLEVLLYWYGGSPSYWPKTTFSHCVNSGKLSPRAASVLVDIVLFHRLMVT